MGKFVHLFDSQLTVVSFSTALEREQMIKLTESLEIDIKVMVTRLSKC